MRIIERLIQFLVIILVISPISSISTVGSPDHYTALSLKKIQITNNKKEGPYSIMGSQLNSTLSIDSIISILKNNTIRRDGILLGWRYREKSSLASADKIYNGYIVGLAGIGDFLRQAADAGYTSAVPLLNDTLIHFTDTVVTKNNLSYWYQLSGERNPGWTGSRYGVSGIIRFLAGAKDYWEYNTNLMHQATNWILAQRDDEGDLPISPGSYFTSGLEYGEAGVIRDLLFAYNSTKDSFFLDAAEQILNNFIKRGEIEGDSLKYLWTEFGEGTDFESLYIKGRDAGNAGIMEVFTQYYTLTGNIDYYNRAHEIARFLMNTGHGGQWTDNSVGYITRRPSNNAILGYWSGSMGIASSLIKLDREKYVSAAANVDALLENLGAVDSIPVSLDEKTKFSGLRMGSIGFAQFVLDLYEIYGTSMERVENILSELTIGNKGLQVYQYSDGEGYSYNIEEGIAGLGMLLLRIERVNQGIDDVNYNLLKESLDPSTEVFREGENKINTYYYSIVLIPLVLILVLLINRKQRK